MEEKIIRDPVHNYITIGEPWLLRLLDTPEIQRLRHIHQLGVSSFTYPGASHSRLSHTLGVLHLMQAAVERLGSRNELQKDDARALLATAVVHDVGHGPFSHVLEHALSDAGGCKHEEWSRRVVEDESTRVNEVLRAEGLVEAVVALLTGEAPNVPAWQKHLLSSQLDVDRMDYIQRDSYFTGAGYGNFDQYRILATMYLEASPRAAGQNEPDLHFAWPDKAKYALEQYIFARFYMWQAVYFHRCTRGYEKLLEAVLDRAAYLMREGAPPPAVGGTGALLQQRPLDLSAYLRLTEYDLLANVHAWSESPDAVLADLSRRFLARDGFKCIELPRRLEGFSAHDRLGEALAHMKRQPEPFSMSPRSYVLEDRGSIRAYKPYRWGEGEETPFIMLSGNQEISDVLRRLRPVTAQPEEFTRYYCPEGFRDELDDILSGTASS